MRSGSITLPEGRRCRARPPERESSVPRLRSCRVGPKMPGDEPEVRLLSHLACPRWMGNRDQAGTQLPYKVGKSFPILNSASPSMQARSPPESADFHAFLPIYNIGTRRAERPRRRMAIGRCPPAAKATMATGKTKVVNVKVNAKSVASAGQFVEELLQRWLHHAGGSLPGEFLRHQGLNPTVLVSQDLLRAASGRWSDCYVAGPLLQLQAEAQQSR